MTQTLDVTGLSEESIQSVKTMIESLRMKRPAQTLTPAERAERFPEGARKTAVPGVLIKEDDTREAPYNEAGIDQSSDEWFAEWKATLEEFAVPGIVVDDRREAIYDDTKS